MLKKTVRSLLGLGGFALHRSGTVDRLLRENERLRHSLNGTLPPGPPLPPGSLAEECQRLRAEVRRLEDRDKFYDTREDYNALAKSQRIVDRVSEFGAADFAEVASWLFSSSLSNHRVVHQRIDEGSMLWRAVKMSGGPILEVGRAAGGSTVLLLAASGGRRLVSIDRAPTHHTIVEHVFKRPDVSRRLTLHDQTSREPIPESEFGMMFIDADHSYEGICHDIATFWNRLKPCDGKPALAAFHDAAENPIAYVPQVHAAVAELVAERGVARVVESWGSMLILEKLSDLDQDRWFAKQNVGFWEQLATPEHPLLKPTVLRGRLHPEKPEARAGSVNVLGDENIDRPSWVKRGVEIERGQRDTGDDNPLRLVREAAVAGEHGIEKVAAVNSAAFRFSVFLRPHRLDAVRLSVRDERRIPLASVDFALGNASRIAGTSAKAGVTIADASFAYRNGYFACTLDVALPAAAPSVVVAVNALDAEGTNDTYPGDSARGFFFNLSSVRKIVGP